MWSGWGSVQAPSSFFVFSFTFGYSCLILPPLYLRRLRKLSTLEKLGRILELGNHLHSDCDDLADLFSPYFQGAWYFEGTPDIPLGGA